MVSPSDPTTPTPISHPWVAAHVLPVPGKGSVSFLIGSKVCINFGSVNTSLITPERANDFKCLVVKDMCVSAEFHKTLIAFIENVTHDAVFLLGTHTASCPDLQPWQSLLRSQILSMTDPFFPGIPSNSCLLWLQIFKGG